MDEQWKMDRHGHDTGKALKQITKSEVHALVFFFGWGRSGVVADEIDLSLYIAIYILALSIYIYTY